MQDKCNYHLKPYSLEYCRDAFRLISEWASKCHGNIEDAFLSTTRLIPFCKVVISPANELSAVIYPDYSRFDMNVLIVHSVLSVSAVKAKKAQIAMLREYINEMFQCGPFHKIVLEFPDFSRLNSRMAEGADMVREAVLREEWPLNGKYYDIVRYGVLRTEWEENHGK